MAVEALRFEVKVDDSELKRLGHSAGSTGRNAADSFTKEYEKADRAFQKLIDKQEKMQALGVSENSMQWKSLQYDIEAAGEKLRQMDDIAKNNSLENINGKMIEIAEATTELSDKTDKLSDSSKEAAQGEKELAQATESTAQAQEHAAASSTRAHHAHGRSLGSFLRSIFIYRAVTRMLSSLRAGLGAVIMADSSMAASLASIRGSFYMAFAPIVNFVIPALRQLLSVIAAVMSAIASFLGGLFGISPAANKNTAALMAQAGATNAAGGAAGSAAKTIAAFDEINQMNDSGGGGGGGGGGGSGLDFSGITGPIDMLSEKFQRIKALVLAIGAALLAWKLTHSFTKSLGVFMMVYGIVRNIQLFIKAWNEGLGSININELFGADFLTGIGALLTFGQKGGAIAFAALGVKNIALAVKDINENGTNLDNLSVLVAGIGDEVLAFGLATGNIPVIVAGVILELSAIIMENWDWIVENILQPMAEWITNIAEKIVNAWEELKKLLGLRSEYDPDFREDPVATYEVDHAALDQFLAEDHDVEADVKFNLPEGNKFLPPGMAEDEGTTFGTDFSLAANESIDLTESFTGIEGSAQSSASEVQKRYNNAANRMKASFASAKSSITSSFSGISGGVIGTLAGLVSSYLGNVNNAVNGTIANINALATAAGAVRLPEVHSTPVKMARGGVIPANHRFLAMLGDQTSGTNVEAPLDTIVNAMQIALNNSGGGGLSASTLRQALTGMAIKVDGRTLGRIVADNINRNRREDGKLALNL